MARREGRIESETGIVCERCVVADSFGRRFLGLMGRSAQGADEGLLLVGSPSLHTSFMRFPIDAVFLDRELRVVGVKANMRPWRFGGRRGAKHILELRSGEAARRGVAVGTHLRLIEPATAPATPQPARQTEEPSGSIRVVLAASDRRFLRVASFLLGRNGFSVSSATRFADLMGAVERGGADVVVLDTSGSGRWTARAAADLDAWRSDVGVLFVADESTTMPDALPKWGSFDRIVAEIRRVHARDFAGASLA
jgi:uncharacterized membrane protein (UPF0127 family)